MNKRYSWMVIAVTGLLGMGAMLNSGLAPTRRTGAPGETTCASCHSGALNTGPGSTSLQAPATYRPGETYTLTFSIADSLVPVGRYGFSSTALDSNHLLAGLVQQTDIIQTSLQVGLVSGNPRQYLGHAQANATDTWSWQWTAPPAGTGPVTIYTVAVAANNNGQNTGDRVYTRSFLLPENTTFPRADFIAAADTACLGSTLLFTDASGGAIDSYTWDFGPGAQPSSADGAGPHEVTFASAGQYPVRLIVSSAEGHDTLVQPVTILAPPVIASWPDTLRVCEGAPAPSLSGLSVNLSGGTPPFAYSWTCDDPGRCGLMAPAAADPVAQPAWLAGADTLRYTVTVSSAGGCVVESAPVEVIQAAAPVPVVVVVAGDTLLAASPAGSYAWAFLDSLSGEITPITGATASRLRPDSLAPGHTGLLVLLATYANGCSRASAPVAIPGGTTSLSPAGSVGLALYPNPASDRLIVAWAPASAEPWTVRLFDATGQPVSDAVTTSAPSVTLTLADLPAGLYLLAAHRGGRGHYRKVLKKAP